jgi:hypothetical protein
MDPRAKLETLEGETKSKNWSGAKRNARRILSDLWGLRPVESLIWNHGQVRCTFLSSAAMLCRPLSLQDRKRMSRDAPG